MSTPSMTNGSTICQIVPSARLDGIKFELMTGKEMEMFSSISILEVNDLVDAKLGLPSTSSQCTTCGSRSIKECDGHFGVIKLPIAVYHPYLIPEIVHMLNQICPGCKSLRHEARTKRRLFHSVRKKLLRYISLRLSRLTRKVLSGDLKDDIPYMKIKRNITEEVGAMKNKSGCRYCAGSSIEWYPTVKFKISNRDMQGRKCLSIVAEVSEKLPKKFQCRSFDELLPTDYWNFVPKFHKQQGINSNSIILSPWQVFYLLQQLDRDFINQFVSRRELLFLSCLPVTPNSHRIVETTHALTDGTRISFDERTKVYKRVSDLGKKLDGVLQHPQFRALTSSFVADRVRDCFVSSKLRSHSSLSKDSPSSVSGMKWLKEVILSKRSDYAFRMTMVGDPKLRLDEVGIPNNIAGSLFVTEYVNTFNLEKLRSSYGIRLWRNQKLIFNRKSNQLQIGDKIERPLVDGDIVLVNRPPSVHQHSLIALSVRTLPSDSVVSINPICCAPLLGDFDGDCLHGYVPQSIRCRVELQELVSLDNQLLNGQDGRNLLSLTHDSLTAAHLLTAKDAFFNKFEIQQLEMLCPHQSPLPAIITGPNLEGPFWTGYQLLSMLFPPSMGIHEDPRNVHGSKGKILVAPHGVFSLQNKPNSIFYRMTRSYGGKSLDYLFSAQEVLCEYLSMRGLTVSLGDIYLTMDSYTRMKMNVELSFALQEAADACRAREMLNMVDISINPLAETEDLSLSRSLHKGTWSRTRINQDSIIAFKNIFCDVQNVIHNYIGRNNSLLTMINAGSKGSLLKLVQQGACLGMQLSASEILFSIPRVLSCVQWNEQKKLDQSGVLNAYDDGGVQKHFVVIKSSLLDGLNPLECLFHSISGRSNLFSENAQLPGTLSRKLMFYMRDLYVAYDGTVRNVYGEEIVQFYYNFAEASQFSNFSSDREASVSIPGGQPVGSWAACSMCEAAYGALECPMNPLCPSPLMKLKTILESSTGKASGGYTASLFLSNKLQRLRYGFELGALEVKNQLEKVFFADIVTTVKILYAGKDTEGLNVSPWIMRFYVDEERMIRRRLDVDLLKDQLQRNYVKRTMFDDSLPNLCIENKWYLSGDKQEKLGAINCITVGVKLVDSPNLLDTIRDSVIPCLLHSLVKGFSEFEKVDILWDDAQKNSSGELFLKVTMSKNCTVGKSWSSIQNACIPIMNLIDWNRSLPDDICNISSMFGINLAWISFLKSLKSSALDVGRNVHQAHLNIVADRLFVSGVFHGLNRRGLKEQRDHTTTSSPFTLACFSNPASCFIDAAKQDCKDSLRGSVDAVSWGKESPTGTGGPFEIIYSGKVCNPIEREDIYSVLHFQDIIQKRMVNPNPSHANDIYNANMWNKNCFTKYKEDTEFSFQRKFSNRNVSYTHILNMESSLRAILLKYPVNRYVTAADREILMKALAFHTSSDAKIGVGVQDIKVGYSSEHRGSKCFIVVRKDGTTEDFSYHKCVAGAAARVSLECAAMIEKKYQEKFQRSRPNQ